MREKLDKATLDREILAVLSTGRGIPSTKVTGIINASRVQTDQPATSNSTVSSRLMRLEGEGLVAVAKTGTIARFWIKVEVPCAI